MQEATSATPSEKVPELTAITPISDADTDVDQAVTKELFADENRNLDTESLSTSESSIQWNNCYGYNILNSDASDDGGVDSDAGIEDEGDSIFVSDDVSVLSLGLSVDSGMSHSMSTIQTIKSANGRAAFAAAAAVTSGATATVATAVATKEPDHEFDSIYAGVEPYSLQDQRQDSDDVPLNHACHSALGITPRQLAGIFSLFDGETGTKQYESTFQTTRSVEGGFATSHCCGESRGKKYDVDENELQLDMSLSVEESENSVNEKEEWKPRAESLQRECSALKQIIRVDSGNILKLKSALETLRENNSIHVVEMRALKLHVEKLRQENQILRREKEVLLENEVEHLETVGILKAELDDLTKSISCRQEIAGPTTDLVRSSSCDTHRNNEILVEQTRLENRLFASQIVDYEEDIDNLREALDCMTMKNEQLKHELTALQKKKSISHQVTAFQQQKRKPISPKEKALTTAATLITREKLPSSPSKKQASMQKEVTDAKRGTPDIERRNIKQPLTVDEALDDNSSSFEERNDCIERKRSTTQLTEELPEYSSGGSLLLNDKLYEYTTSKITLKAQAKDRLTHSENISSGHLYEQVERVRKQTLRHKEALCAEEKGEIISEEERIDLPLPYPALNIWLQGGCKLHHPSEKLSMSGSCLTNTMQSPLHDLENLTSKFNVELEKYETGDAFFEEKEHQGSIMNISTPLASEEIADDKTKVDEHRSKDNNGEMIEQQKIKISQGVGKDQEIELQLENDGEKFMLDNGDDEEVRDVVVLREVDLNSDETLFSQADVGGKQTNSSTSSARPEEMNEKENTSSDKKREMSVETKRVAEPNNNGTMDPATTRKEQTPNVKGDRCEPWEMFSEYCLFT